jgi:CheY-like chemotaxis protein
MAREFKPNAITLDIRMPVMDGWTVLDRLKHDPTTRHIPVHVLSVEEGRQRSLQLGALAYLQKARDQRGVTQALGEDQDLYRAPGEKLLIGGRMMRLNAIALSS